MGRIWESINASNQHMPTHVPIGQTAGSPQCLLSLSQFLQEYTTTTDPRTLLLRYAGSYTGPLSLFYGELKCDTMHGACMPPLGVLSSTGQYRRDPLYKPTVTAASPVDPSSSKNSASSIPVTTSRIYIRIYLPNLHIPSYECHTRALQSHMPWPFHRYETDHSYWVGLMPTGGHIHISYRMTLNNGLGADFN